MTRMMRFAFFFFFVFLFFSWSFAQKQNNQWRFGNGGGLSFNSTPPSFVSGAAISTPEGSASIADKTSGDLLFYTNGVTVWDSQNQVIPNGNGLLGGNPTQLSSTTAAVIIPKPGSNTLYYIVTIDEQASSNGVRYSLVDMTLNGGLGDIVATQKNILLFQTGSEKLEVVPAANGQDIWLITHDNPGNSFYSFLLTSTGFQTVPIVSTVGGVQGNGAGHLKVNRQFNKLACGSLFDGTMELFDFNNSTGVVSNVIAWNLPTSVFSSRLIYGVEFSPDGSVLYISNLEKLVQYDISHTNPVAIANSLYQLPSTGFSQPASLQLGPDGKIYINSGAINAINCPNVLGPGCGFQSDVIANQNGGGGYGLPKWVYYANNNAAPPENSILIEDTCREQPSLFSIKDSTGVINVEWNFGDPNSGINNTASGLTANHQFSQSGFYNIKALVTTACGTDTLKFFGLEIISCIPPCIGSINLGNSDSCVQNSISFSINTTSNLLSAVWNFDDVASGNNNSSSSNSPSHVFSSPGSYNIRVIANLDCGLDTLYKTIEIVDCDTSNTKCELLIPNAFSPNADGLNDNFKTYSKCGLEQFNLTVFNRWGQTVFKTTDPNQVWNGKYAGGICPIGTYVYLIIYKFPLQAQKKEKGILTLFR